LKKLHYISFAQTGPGFLGALFIELEVPLSRNLPAELRTRGLNPGGEMLIVAIPDNTPVRIAPADRNRVIKTHKELERIMGEPVYKLETLPPELQAVVDANASWICKKCNQSQEHCPHFVN
jgi:hypothetical protein